MSVKLSILDQSPIFKGETAREAFGHTLELARKAEQWGYHRFWVSEHHDTGSFVAGTSPEVLISYLLARTERIRIGSGGVMLQHYSPLKVAENFNVLATLAPGRVDLGVGRAPGGLHRSTKALQQGFGEGALSLDEKIAELKRYVDDALPDDHPFAGLKAYPVPPAAPELHLLGGSESSAELAAKLGLSYVFAQFINSSEETFEKSVRAYYGKFNGEGGVKPRLIVGVYAIVADTDEEAASLRTEHKIVKVRLESGRSVNLGSVEQAEQYGKESGEPYELEIQDPIIHHGSPGTVREKLLAFASRYGIEELIVTTMVQDSAKRLRSYELLAEAFARVPAEG